MESKNWNRAYFKMEILSANTNLHLIPRRFSRNSSEPRMYFNIYLTLQLQDNLILSLRLSTQSPTNLIKLPILLYQCTATSQNSTMAAPNSSSMIRKFSPRMVKMLNLWNKKRRLLSSLVHQAKLLLSIQSKVTHNQGINNPCLFSILSSSLKKTTKEKGTILSTQPKSVLLTPLSLNQLLLYFFVDLERA